MPLREQGAKEQGAVAQNAHISTTAPYFVRVDPHLVLNTDSTYLVLST